MIKPAYPDGHLRSPMIDVNEVKRDSDRIWPAEPELVGVDLNLQGMEVFIDGPMRKCFPEFDYAKKRPQDAENWTYYEDNGEFRFLDARALFTILLDRRPGRMIEIGSGFSTLLTADVNRRFLGNSIDVHCIDPHPHSLLKGDINGVSEVIVAQPQEVPIDYYLQLEAGDVLFINSSHIVKTGSDVNFLCFEVLPRLVPGVLVQVQNIFLPSDYPKPWVLDEQRNWNEQYVLQAMLTYSNAFDVVFGTSAAIHYHRDLLLQITPPGNLTGGSFWIERSKPQF